MEIIQKGLPNGTSKIFAQQPQIDYLKIEDKIEKSEILSDE